MLYRKPTYMSESLTAHEWKKNYTNVGAQNIHMYVDVYIGYTISD